MKTIYAGLTLLILASCNLNKETKALQKISYKGLFESAKRYDTITSVDAYHETDTVVFKSKSGSYYLLFKSGEPENDSLKMSESELEAQGAFFSPPTGDNTKACTSDYYDGVDRKAAKLVVPSGAAIILTGVASLLAPGFLKPDAQLCTTISTATTSVRTADEKKNVHVQEAWLFTYKREPDEDYHLILGTTKDWKTAKFFTAEIGGLPARSSTSYSKIKKGRDDFESELGITSCSGFSYSTTHKADPFKVEISGALFFDAVHCKAQSGIGPGWARPRRYWEIHPVTAFKIL